jgi:dethiobiotin synthetase
MQIFIAGTSTNVGKTIVASWLCLHTQSAYFKPIQTGASEGLDSAKVLELTGTKIYPEVFTYQKPVAPYLAAKLEHKPIRLSKIKTTTNSNLIIEGAGGLLVPLNKHLFMVDLIKKINVPVILVATSTLGTINHTLLSLEALNKRKIATLGVVMNGPLNSYNKKAIESYGNIKVLAELPYLKKITNSSLQQIKLPYPIKKILKSYNLTSPNLNKYKNRSFT